MLGGDNAVYQHRKFSQAFYIYEILAHYGVLSNPNGIELTIQQGGQVQKITVDAVDRTTLSKMQLARLERKAPATAPDKKKLYFAKALDARTLYIQYNSCKEDPKLPMQTFTQQIVDQLDDKGYDRVILDLRGNGGGSDGAHHSAAARARRAAQTGRSGVLHLDRLGYLLVRTHQRSGVQAGRRNHSRYAVGRQRRSLRRSASVHAGAQRLAGEAARPSLSTSPRCSRQHSPMTCSRSSPMCSHRRPGYITLPVLTRLCRPFCPAPMMPDSRQQNLSRGALAVQLGRDYAARTDTALNNPDTSFGDVCIIAYDAPYISWAAHAGLDVGRQRDRLCPEPCRSPGRNWPSCSRGMLRCAAIR